MDKNIKNVLTEILLRHTGIVSEEHNKVIYLRGHVDVKRHHYYLNLRLPHFPSLKDFKLVVCHGFSFEKLTEKSAGFCSSWSLDDLLANLPTLLSKSPEKEHEFLPAELNTIDSADTTKVTDFYSEIAALYNPDLYCIELNEHCTLIRFSKFSINEQHYMEVELPSLSLRAHSLPDCIKANELLSKCETLTAMVELFQKYVQDLQPFYDSFLSIDELCRVIQPAKPTTKHNYRLFVLRERVFLKLVIADPFAPSASMKVQIIGPTPEVEQLRRTYSEGLKDWDYEMDIQRNLLRIFDLCYFPMQPDVDGDEDEQWFCNICYSYRLELNERGGCDVPVVSCDNPQCTLVFHDVCLLEWFSTLSDNFSFLNVSFGCCPFCKAKLSTSFQGLQEN